MQKEKICIEKGKNLKGKIVLKLQTIIVLIDEVRLKGALY